MKGTKTVKIILLFLFLLGLQGCFVYGDKKPLEVETTIKLKHSLKASLTSVDLSSGQLTLHGSGFKDVTSLSLQGSGTKSDLKINYRSDTQLVASASNALSLLLNGTFNLVMGTAEAEISYPITFTQENNSIDLSKLKNTGASPGYVIKFNGSNWVAAPQNETQVFQGTWNANTNVPDLSIASATPGDYYIVSTAGTYNSIAYAVGDWIISDGYNWQRIPVANTSVTSFQGRKGIVSLSPSDYVSLRDPLTNKLVGSKLDDIADIDLTGLANGQMLKWNASSSKWEAFDLSASSPLSYNSSTGVLSLSGSNILATPLTSLASGTGAVTSSDTILEAMGKLMSLPGDYISKSSGATLTTGTIALSGTAMITVPTATGVTATEVANVTYVNNAIANNGVWDKNTSTISYTAGNVGVGTTTPASTFHIEGSFGTNIVNKTADYTLTASDSIVTADASAGAVTLTLPSAIGVKGRHYIIKKIDSSNNAVVIAAAAGQTIDGAATVSITAQWEAKTLVSDGAHWYLLGTIAQSSGGGFFFSDIADVGTNTVVTSSTITATQTMPVSISGSGGPQLSINGGAWTTSGTVSTGQTLAVRVTTASTASTNRPVTVSLGAKDYVWNVSTGTFYNSPGDFVTGATPSVVSGDGRAYGYAGPGIASTWNGTYASPLITLNLAGYGGKIQNSLTIILQAAGGGSANNDGDGGTAGNNGAIIAIRLTPSVLINLNKNINVYIGPPGVAYAQFSITGNVNPQGIPGSGNPMGSPASQGGQTSWAGFGAWDAMVVTSDLTSVIAYTEGGGSSQGYDGGNTVTSRYFSNVNFATELNSSNGYVANGTRGWHPGDTTFPPTPTSLFSWFATAYNHYNTLSPLRYGQGGTETPVNSPGFAGQPGFVWVIVD